MEADGLAVHGHLLPRGDLPRGAMFGTVSLVDVVESHPSVFATPGLWHWVLADPKLLSQPIPRTGRLGLSTGSLVSDMDPRGRPGGKQPISAVRAANRTCDSSWPPLLAARSVMRRLAGLLVRGLGAGRATPIADYRAVGLEAHNPVRCCSVS